MKQEIKLFFKAFTYAAHGLISAVKNERNMRFHICAAASVIILSLFYDFSALHYCVLFLCIGSVISAELINTAVESAVDAAVGEKRSAAAGTAKDCAAAAVLVSSVISVVCAAALFWDTERLGEIIGWILCRPPALAGIALWAVLAFCFIFKNNGKGS